MQKSWLSTLWVSLALLAAESRTSVAQPSTSDGFAKTEADLFEKIDHVRVLADDIVIDGQGNDWRGIPSYATDASRTDLDATRRIMRTAIAPRERDLLVAISTAASPSQDEAAFGLDIDFMGLCTRDLQIPLDRSGAPSLWIYEPGQPAREASVSSIRVAIRDIVEVTIPYADLARVLPPTMADHLSGAAARSWVRVFPYSWNKTTGAFVDWGPAAASYRLTSVRFPLDPPLPKRGQRARVIPMPLDGKWYIGQGAQQGPFGVGDHRDHWAYDLDQRDVTGHPSRVRDSRKNDDYYGFGQPILARQPSRAIELRSSADDHPPFFAGSENLPSNYLYLDIGQQGLLRLVHCRRNSILVKQRDQLEVGTTVAAVGNSGPSAWPHLHLELCERGDTRRSIPLAFGSVRVSLNSAANDYWTRELDMWELREGFFVEPTPQRQD
jgi:hypothetical protein